MSTSPKPQTTNPDPGQDPRSLGSRPRLPLPCGRHTGHTSGEGGKWGSAPGPRSRGAAWTHRPGVRGLVREGSPWLHGRHSHGAPGAGWAAAGQLSASEAVPAGRGSWPSTWPQPLSSGATVRGPDLGKKGSVTQRARVQAAPTRAHPRPLTGRVGWGLPDAPPSEGAVPPSQRCPSLSGPPAGPRTLAMPSAWVQVQRCPTGPGCCVQWGTGLAPSLPPHPRPGSHVVGRGPGAMSRKAVTADAAAGEGGLHLCPQVGGGRGPGEGGLLHGRVMSRLGAVTQWVRLMCCVTVGNWPPHLQPLLCLHCTPPTQPLPFSPVPRVASTSPPPRSPPGSASSPWERLGSEWPVHQHSLLPSILVPNTWPPQLGTEVPLPLAGARGMRGRKEVLTEQRPPGRLCPHAGCPRLWGCRRPAGSPAGWQPLYARR